MPSVVVFASGFVGKSVLQFLSEDKLLQSCIDGLVLLPKEKREIVPIFSCPSFSFSKGGEKELIHFLSKLHPDLIILAWWPYILSKEIIQTANKGIVNFHPSLLPYNRGKHYNFWTIVEGTPFGVTLHLVDEKIDSGPILFQQKIKKTWEDTGATLYQKAQEAIILLFKEKVNDLFFSDFQPIPQNEKEGSFRLGKELRKASKINLDSTYTARELLNLLRARTFYPHPGCYFYDDQEKYEVRVEIKRMKNG